MLRALILLVLLPPAEAAAQYNPYAPQQNVDARTRRAWREQAVAYAGAEARDLVEKHGDQAVLALLACSQPVAKKLAGWHNAGGLDKLPRPKQLLQAIGQPAGGDDVALWAIQHQTELTDSDAEEAYCTAPLDYALGLKPLGDGAAESRARRLAAQAAVTPAQSQQPQPQQQPQLGLSQIPLDNRTLAWVGGGLLVVVLIVWGKKRQSSGGVGV
jgi:hypothetical protein